MKKLVALPLLLVLLVAFSADARMHGKKDWNWWKSKKIATDINLTEDQTTQLNDIEAKYNTPLTEAREDYVTKKTAYKEAKANKATSDADVIKAFDVMWDSKYKMKRIKLDRGLEMRQVLTQEQITQLGEIKQAHKDKMKHEFKKHKEKMKDTQTQ